MSQASATQSTPRETVFHRQTIRERKVFRLTGFQPVRRRRHRASPGAPVASVRIGRSLDAIQYVNYWIFDVDFDEREGRPPRNAEVKIAGARIGSTAFQQTTWRRKRPAQLESLDTDLISLDERKNGCQAVFRIVERHTCGRANRCRVSPV